MTAFLTSSDKKVLKVVFLFLLFGSLLIVSAYSPFMNPPQCPSYETVMPDGSDCIIGANIGAGMIWFSGLGVIVISSTVMLGLLLTRYLKHTMRKR